ncbi:MAG: hypothetical protein LAT77_02365 [Aliidiomarina sp.]|uniref:hypothetical protein n=1 Tax=Aliidiomarina sp. TaxID=1872439 RepID=UPI0025C69B88|nr:hypothetical protein [Aliidiomarina sp.]MCH8500737.1 hypothetical protein [Aliidiomarina sp.]
MNFHRLTRFPKHAYPTDLDTGNAAIDQYLRNLDTRLVGSTGVRKITLEETRDHLLESSELYLQQGESPEAAGQQAVASFGDAEVHAQEQRQGRYKVFGTMFLRFGLTFATLMLLMSLLSMPSFLGEEKAARGLIENVPTLAKTYLFNAIFFGFFMSYWYTFAFTQAKPAPVKPTDDGEVLEVYSQKSSKFAAVFLLIAMGFISLSCLAGLFGWGYMAPSGVALNIILFLLGAQMAIGGFIAWDRYELSQEAFTIRSFTGNHTVPRASIVDLQEKSFLKSFLGLGIGKHYALIWQDEAGQRHAINLVLNGEMHNSDSLIATLKATADDSATVASDN